MLLWFLSSNFSVNNFKKRMLCKKDLQTSREPGILMYTRLGSFFRIMCQANLRKNAHKFFNYVGVRHDISAHTGTAIILGMISYQGDFHALF